MSSLLPRTAVITGITGEGGSYLAELLLEKDCQVHGIKCRASIQWPGYDVSLHRV